MTVTPERITDDITVNTSTRASLDVQSVTLSDGSFIIVYLADDADGTPGNDIVAQQFDAIGNKIGGEMILASTTSTTDNLQFDIRALENNQIALAFEEDGGISIDAFTVADGTATADPALDQTVGSEGVMFLHPTLSGDSLSTLKLHYALRVAGNANLIIEERDVSGGVFTAASSFGPVGGDADIEVQSDTLSDGNTVIVIDDNGPSNEGGGSFSTCSSLRPTERKSSAIA